MVRLGQPEAAYRFYPFLFGVSEAVFQVGQDIVNMLSADGKPDGVGADARFQLGLPAELGMSGGRWMNHQGFHIRHVGQQGKQLQMIDKGLSLFFFPLDLKGENRSGALGKIFLVKLMVRVAA